MGSNQVYKSLLELFPEIDTRVLRAVAIEHRKDADLAVMAVLDEIIPFCIERSTPNSPLSDRISVGEPAAVQIGYNMNGGDQQSLHDAEDGHNEQRNTYDAHHERITKAAKLTVSERVQESSISMSADVYSHGEPAPLIDKSGVNTCQIESSEDPEIEETISAYKCPESKIKTSSRHNLIIDVLEEIMADARSNKKILIYRMESVISLMREVEDKEQAAQQAKVEAAMGGINMLDKVEELRKMLQHAKEANDMHAGEVYGEKAILATEFRELQSRVLFLSDERDKSHAVLNEMQQKLQVRLAAAENEIESSEQEKLLKEKSAHKALADQEMVMEKVVQESKILKQQSENYAKLQEFLVDRGRVVDMLQGEIAVICQDVMLLKDKFDQHVPFSKSVSSSQTSCILASSSSSLKSLIPNKVEPVPNQIDPLGTEDKSARDNRKALIDDGWELFDHNDIET
ncbi:hypothetical protein ACJIZ3_016722 [Penstemon smallii]|uniref:CUE domain-containing protein n=1 Tax=Penstemon smallii TaxID=265156 RepID=A0ABD3SU94_9LAMI